MPASAFASALLDWWTLPSSPGLRTRIPTAVLLGLSCRATAPASADWPLALSWPATCVPEPLCDWSIDWPVRLPLPASAFASALLDWSTLPSSPGLSTRIPTAVLLGLSCAATARAPASCQFSFDWPATWVPDPDWQPQGAVNGAAVPPWDWSIVWPVRLMLPASAFASALLDWWTLPSSPGLRTRIPTAVLLGLSCRATAPASADWPLAFSWPATCVPEPLCDWSIDWPVRLPLPASAFASALLDWSTLPSSPGLSTRIPTAVLLGSAWPEPARAPAACPLECPVLPPARDRRSRSPCRWRERRSSRERRRQSMFVSSCSSFRSSKNPGAGAPGRDHDEELTRAAQAPWSM